MIYSEHDTAESGVSVADKGFISWLVTRFVGWGERILNCRAYVQTRSSGSVPAIPAPLLARCSHQRSSALLTHPTSCIEPEPCYACMKTTRIQDYGSLYALVDQGESSPPFLSFTLSAHLFLYPAKTLLITRETTVPLPPTQPSSMSLSPADFSHVFVIQTLSCRFSVPTWFSHRY
ncbi:hypothetical protein K443DRAFT_686784, partial [Laccaria amethystina LaAM-08-1]